MEKTIIVGCDLHDQTMLLKVAVGREKAEKISIENSRNGRQILISLLKQRAKKEGATKTIVAYEASGQGFGFYDELEEAGIECKVLAPNKIARSAKHKRSKTDEKDADRLLDLLRGHVLAGNPLPSIWVPDLQTRDDREVTRTRMDLTDKLTKVKIQIRMLLKRNGAGSLSELGQGWTKKKKEWLKSLCQKGSQLKTGAQVALSSLVRQYESLQAELNILGKEVVKLAQEERHEKKVEALVKLKGVAVLSAIIFLVEMGEAKRFKNRRQMGSFTGLVPSSHESGESHDRKGHITRQGCGFIRRMLCQCVWARVRTDSREQEVYERISAKNPKHKKIAVVAIMRRLAIRMWHESLKASA